MKIKRSIFLCNLPIYNSKDDYIKQLQYNLTSYCSDYSEYPRCYTVPMEERPRVIYMKACHKFNLTPSSSFLKGLTSGVVNLNHQNLGPDGARAVALGLVVNCTLHLISS